MEHQIASIGMYVPLSVWLALVCVRLVAHPIPTLDATLVVAMIG